MSETGVELLSQTRRYVIKGAVTYLSQSRDTLTTLLPNVVYTELIRGRILAYTVAVVVHIILTRKLHTIGLTENAGPKQILK